MPIKLSDQTSLKEDRHLRLLESALLSGAVGILASIAILGFVWSPGKNGWISTGTFLLFTIPSGLLGMLTGVVVGRVMRVKRFTVAAVIVLILAGVIAAILPYLCILFLSLYAT